MRRDDEHDDVLGEPGSIDRSAIERELESGYPPEYSWREREFDDDLDDDERDRVIAWPAPRDDPEHEPSEPWARLDDWNAGR